MSLLNVVGGGLTTMGAGIASFASAAGLEAQKADLAQQGIRLSDQLQGARETAGRTQAGEIAATQAAADAKTAMDRLQVSSANALQVANVEGSSRVQAAQAEAGGAVQAATITSQAHSGDVKAELAQNLPFVTQQIATEAVKTGMASDEAALAHKGMDITLGIATEMAKPPAQQDKAKLDALYAQRTALVPSATMTQLAVANDGLLKTFQQLVTSDNADIARLTAQAADPATNSDPAALAKVNAELDSVKTQRAGHIANLNATAATGQALVGRATGTLGPAASGTPEPAPGAPPPAAGKRTAYTPFDPHAAAAGKPGATPGAAAAPAATASARAAATAAPGSAAQKLMDGMRQIDAGLKPPTADAPLLDVYAKATPGQRDAMWEGVIRSVAPPETIAAPAKSPPPVGRVPTRGSVSAGIGLHNGQ